MRRWLAILSLATLTAGAGTLAAGCDSSTSAKSRDAAPGDAVGTGGLPGAGGAVATGGWAGTGGLLGYGGASAAAGATGVGGPKTGGTAVQGTGGRGGAAGGVGTGGSNAGGAGGTAAAGGGGATAMDASADGPEDGPGLDGSQPIVYSGCGYAGGIDRAVVAKFDGREGVCVTLILQSPSGAPDAGFGMMISPYWGVAAIVLWPSSTPDCAVRFPSADALGASSASGSVTIDRMSGTIDIDAVFDFPSNDAGPAQSVEMKAQGVDFMSNC